MDEFQKQSNSGAKLATIEDMQNFVEGFSEFSAAQRNAGKHVTLITELSRHVDSRNLMQVSSVSALALTCGGCPKQSLIPVPRGAVTAHPDASKILFCHRKSLPVALHWIKHCRAGR